MERPKDYIWNFLGSTGSQVLYFVFNLILARFLTPYDFGTIGVLAVLLSIADTVIDSGLGGSLIKEKKITKTDCSTIFIFNLIISILLYTVVYYSANSIELYFDIVGLNNVVKILCLIFIINAFRIVPYSLLIRELKFKNIAVINFISVFLAGAGAVIAAIFDAGVYSLVLYSLLRSIVNVGATIIVSKYRLSFEFKFDSLKKLYKFGVFTTCSNIIDTIYENIITLMFGKFLGISASGYLTQAKKLEETASKSIASTLNSVSFPILVRKIDNKALFANEATSIFSTTILILFPILFTISIYSDDIIVLLYGDKWKESAQYLSILMFAGAFMTMETLTRNFIKSLGEVRRLFIITCVKRICGILLIFMFLFISPLIIIYAYVLGAGIGYLFNLIVYCKIMHTSIINEVINHFKLVFPSIIYFFVSKILFETYDIPFILMIIISLMILTIYYFAICKLFNLQIVSTIIYNKYKFKL